MGSTPAFITSSTGDPADKNSINFTDFLFGMCGDPAPPLEWQNKDEGLLATTKVARPKDVQNLRGILAKAQSDEEALHVIGNGFPNVEQGSTVTAQRVKLLSLDRLEYLDTELVELPDLSHMVVMSGGRTVGELNVYAQSHGYELPSTPIDGRTTVGGAVTTYALGSSLNSGMLNMVVRRVVVMCREKGIIRDVTNEAVISEIRGSMQDYIVLAAGFEVIRAHVRVLNSASIHKFTVPHETSPGLVTAMMGQVTDIQSIIDTQFSTSSTQDEEVLGYVDPYTNTILVLKWGKTDELRNVDMLRRRGTSEKKKDRSSRGFFDTLSSTVSVYVADKINDAVKMDPSDKVKAALVALKAQAENNNGEATPLVSLGFSHNIRKLEAYSKSEKSGEFLLKTLKLAKENSIELPIQLSSVAAARPESVMHNPVPVYGDSQDGYIAVWVPMNPNEREIARQFKSICTEPDDYFNNNNSLQIS